MIYKDADSKYDVEDEPCDREEPCLNCGEFWDDHSGWKCRLVDNLDISGNIITNFHEYLPNEKYLTQSMKDSVMPNSYNQRWAALAECKSKFFIDSFGATLVSEPAHQTSKPTIDQWQAWAHNQPGDCACGIKRETCDYHRNLRLKILI